MRIGRSPDKGENLTIHFKVKDFNAWQTSYNGNEKNRTSAGITKSKVFRSSDDPNEAAPPEGRYQGPHLVLMNEIKKRRAPPPPWRVA